MRKLVSLIGLVALIKSGYNQSQGAQPVEPRGAIRLQKKCHTGWGAIAKGVVEKKTYCVYVLSELQLNKEE